MFNLARGLLTKSRHISTSAVRRGGHGDGHFDIGGIPGANLPFDIHNRYKLALYFALHMGSGFSVPFLLMRFHFWKKEA